MKNGLNAGHVVEMARKYKNWQEKSRIGTRAQMWDFHWSPGDANYTIWAMLYQDYTGRSFQGQAWCAMFASDIVVLALQDACGMEQAAAVEKAKKLLGGDLPYNCQQFVNQHRTDVRLDHVPETGAMVIFWTGRKYGHWGICSGVDNDKKGFTSVEGNTSGGADKVDPDGGAVVEKWHSLDVNTLFWHPDYDTEAEAGEKEYTVISGMEGLKVTASSLYIRKQPEGGTPVGILHAGDVVYPERKRFVNGKAWYFITHGDLTGWISSHFLEGWVYEECGRWWYVMEGYQFTAGDWQWIDGAKYYFDSTGYMAQSRWILAKDGEYYYVTAGGSMARSAYVKSTEKEQYYWVSADGVWEPEYDTSAPDLEKYQVVA